ncbi:MAG: peptidase MA family metallohydrolase [Candidatus Brocadiia bacterium]
MTSLLLRVALALLGGTAIEAGQWTILSERGESPVAATVAELLPRAQRDAEAKLGLRLTRRGTVVLCATQESFRRSTPGVDHRHTLGVAYPGRCVIYLNCQLIESSPLESLAITLRHEMSHVLVGEVRRRGQVAVPRWFDEGVAVWSAGKVPRYDPGHFERAVAAGALRPLSELSSRFPADPVERAIAYEQSESFVRHVVDRHGEEAIRRILRAAAQGMEFAAAFEHVVGEDLATAEEEWLDELRPRWRWVSWLFHSVSLFMLMSLLALVAFWVYWRRRRRKYREWELEEWARGGCDEGW